jgi:lipoprotein NlpI
MSRSVVVTLVALAAIFIGNNRANSEGAIAEGIAPGGVAKGYAITLQANWPNRDVARANALDRCRKPSEKAASGAPLNNAKARARCEVVMSFSNKCAAVAVDPKDGTPGAGWAIGDTQKDADDAALARCRAAAGARRDFCKVTNQLCDGTADDFRTCANASGDEAIAACTRGINSGRYKTRDLAKLYDNRGVEWSAKRDRDRAIADYNESIRIDPTNALTYNNRGDDYRILRNYDRALADLDQAVTIDPKYARAYKTRGDIYRDKSDLDRAIADYTQAISLDPKFANAFKSRARAFSNKGDNDRAIADYSQLISINPKSDDAYFNRGRINLYAGSLDNALADFNQASALAPKYAYAALWLDIVSQRNKLPSRLPQTSSQIDMTAWPAPVIRLFMGQMTSGAVLAAADDPDAATKKAQVCEANFYTGELSLLKGEKDEAARLFRLAASDCPHGFIEWDAANAELKTLGAAP